MQVDLKFKIKAGDGQITFPIYRVPVSGGSEPVDAGDIQSLQVDLDRQVLQSSQKEVMVTAAYSNVAEGAHQIVITGALNNVAFALVYAVRAEELGVPAEVVAPNAYVSLAPTGEGTIEQQIKDLQDRIGTADGEIVAITAALSDMATKEEVQETLDKILEAIQALPDGQSVSAQVALNTAAIEGLQGDVSQLDQEVNTIIAEPIEKEVSVTGTTTTSTDIPLKNGKKYTIYVQCNTAVDSAGLYVLNGSLQFIKIATLSAEQWDDGYYMEYTPIEDVVLYVRPYATGTVSVKVWDETIPITLTDIDTDITDIGNNITQILKRLEFGFDSINSISIWGKEKSTVIGKFVQPYDGNLGVSADYFSSDYYDVDETKNYFVSSCKKLYGAFYNANKEYISGITDESTNISYKVITPPANAKYIRVSTHKDKIDVATFGAVDISLSDNINIAQHPYIVLLKKKTESSDYIVNGIATTMPFDGFGVVDGKYVDPSSGNLGNNASFSATEDYIPIESSKTYYFYGFTKVYGAWYNSSKTKVGDGIIRDTGSGVLAVISPSNAAFLRISGKTTEFSDCFLTQSNFTLAPNIKVPVSCITDWDGVETVVYDVKPSGGGDFTKLSDCFDAITDSSYNKRYIVNFYGDGTEYDTLDDKPYVSGQIGLRIPPFTKLVGVGGKEKNILVRRLQIESADQNDSLLNLHMTSELQGFTLIAEKTRYVVHDDYYATKELNRLNYERHVSDVEVIGSNMYYNQVWGAGCYSGANWVFENCIFNSARNLSYTCHNNTGFTNIAKQKFVNCRFITAGATSIRLGSITNNANGINVIAEFYGCVLKHVNLTEENAQSLGQGILFKVTGFGNDLKNGNANLVISNTDGEDYSANIDLI